MSQFGTEAPRRRRGLTEKYFVVLNPLPKTTETVLFEAAGFQNLVPAKDETDPFLFQWRYDFGENMDLIELRAGDSMVLRESEAEEFRRAFRDRGGVVFAQDSDPAEIKKATVKGLETALKYWDERGARHIREYRKNAGGLGKEEMEELKETTLWAYHLNAQKALAVRSLLEETRGVKARTTVTRAKAADEKDLLE